METRSKRKRVAEEAQSPLKSELESLPELEPSAAAPDLTPTTPHCSWSVNVEWDSDTWTCTTPEGTLTMCRDHAETTPDSQHDVLQAWAEENDKETIPKLTEEKVDEYRALETTLTNSFAADIAGSHDTHVIRYAIRPSQSFQWFLVKPFTLTPGENGTWKECAEKEPVTLQFTSGKFQGNDIRLTESRDSCVINGKRFLIDGTNKIRAWQVKLLDKEDKNRGLTIMSLKVSRRDARVAKLANVLEHRNVVTTGEIVDLSRNARFRKLQGIGKAACELQSERARSGHLGKDAVPVELVSSTAGIGLPVINPSDYLVAGKRGDGSEAPVNMDDVINASMSE